MPNNELIMEKLAAVAELRALRHVRVLNAEELARLRRTTWELQSALGLFSTDPTPSGPRSKLAQFLSGLVPVHVPDSVPKRCEVSSILSLVPHKFFFAVWGRLHDPLTGASVDLVFDRADQDTLRALEIAAYARGDFSQDGWISIGNLLHSAHLRGWAELPADPAFGLNYVCLRQIYGPDALIRVLEAAAPPAWPQRWPHRSTDFG